MGLTSHKVDMGWLECLHSPPIIAIKIVTEYSFASLRFSKRSTIIDLCIRKTSVESVID